MRNPTETAALKSITGGTSTNDPFLSAVLGHYRRATRKSDQFLLVKAQLLTPPERKEAAARSRASWS